MASSRALRPHEALQFEGDDWDDLPGVLRAAADWAEENDMQARACDLVLAWEQNEAIPEDDCELVPTLTVFFARFP